MFSELIQMPRLRTAYGEFTVTFRCILSADTLADVAKTIAVIAGRILTDECVLPENVAPVVEWSRVNGPVYDSVIPSGEAKVICASESLKT